MGGFGTFGSEIVWEHFLQSLIIFSGWLLNNPLFPPPFGHSSSSSSPKLKNKTKDGSSFTSGGQYLNFHRLSHGHLKLKIVLDLACKEMA